MKLIKFRPKNVSYVYAIFMRVGSQKNKLLVISPDGSQRFVDKKEFLAEYEVEPARGVKSPENELAREQFYEALNDSSNEDSKEDSNGHSDDKLLAESATDTGKKCGRMKKVASGGD